jgi:hypothetical protein
MATYKPGEKAPDSGELIEIGPRGGKVEDGRRVVIERGETIPPTSEPGNNSLKTNTSLIRYLERTGTQNFGHPYETLMAWTASPVSGALACSKLPASFQCCGSVAHRPWSRSCGAIRQRVTVCLHSRDSPLLIPRSN